MHPLNGSPDSPKGVVGLCSGLALVSDIETNSVHLTPIYDGSTLSLYRYIMGS